MRLWSRAVPVSVLLLAAAVAAGGCTARESGGSPPADDDRGSAEGRPNVIVILTDDQGYGDIAAHGNDVVRTPNLDRLAAHSIRLTDFHVDPTCSPTRAALLTGRYSTRTGVWHTIMGRSLMAPEERTLAEVFAEAGYRTGMFGKWHLGDNYPLRPHDQGFHEALYHGGGVVGQVGDYPGNDLYDDTYFRNGVPEQVSGYSTDVWFDEALSFVERNRDGPFFLYLATNAAHWPYFVDDEYIAPYRAEGVPPTMARFLAMITNIDENVGRLRARLAEWNLDQNTILVFMTDNGSAEGWSNWREEPGTWTGFNAGMRAGKGSAYDGGHRVPLFLHWPAGGFAQSREVPLLSAHVDLLPTLAELSGIALPEELALDGTSLASLLRGAAEGEDAVPPELAERTLFVHSQRVDVPIEWRRSAVMTERWRLIDGTELYDIVEDPGQTRDVAADHRDVVARLRSAYDGWWDSLEPAFARTVRIGLGAPEENPTSLSSHDWRTADDSQVVWNSDQVNCAYPGNGYWAVDVLRGGEYEITLRRWPRPSTLGLGTRHARLRVGEVERETVTSPYDSEARFRVRLSPGPTRLQTWLTGRRGESRGAYFVYVRSLS